jgi:hypothetical protein
LGAWATAASSPLEGGLPVGVAGGRLLKPRRWFWLLLPGWEQQAAQRPGGAEEVWGEGPQPPVAAAEGVLGGWGDDVAAAAAPVDLLKDAGAVASAGGSKVDALLGCQVTMAALMSR